MSVTREDWCPPVEASAEHPKQRALRRMKGLALVVLLGAAALYALSVFLERKVPGMAYVKAFSGAAMVGSLADWFAVVALFRHPLGFAFIPHTAIIPKNKDRIADNLGEFVQSRFLAPEKIVEVIREFGPADRLADWLAHQPNHQVLVEASVKGLVFLVEMLDDEAVQKPLRAFLTAQLSEMDLASLSAKLLDALQDSDKHQVFLDEGMDKLSELLEKDQVKKCLTEAIAQRIAMPSWWNLDKKVAGAAVGKAYEAFRETVAEVRATPDHPLRQWSSETVRETAERLRQDRGLQARIHSAQQELVDHPAIQHYVASLWVKVREWVRQDLSEPGSVLRARLGAGTDWVASGLKRNVALRGWIDEAILRAAPGIVVAYRTRIGEFIARQIKNWNEDYMVDQIETSIGSDLQYIRLNGALVGGVVGLVIYGATQFWR
ncbi:MAG: DUF445 domain-containing protein [Acidiferrobacteraceae bacterium]